MLALPPVTRAPVGRVCAPAVQDRTNKLPMIKLSRLFLTMDVSSPHCVRSRLETEFKAAKDAGALVPLGRDDVIDRFCDFNIAAQIGAEGQTQSAPRGKRRLS